MSIRAMNIVWESKLRYDEKLVALCLADFGNDEGESIYPAVGYIAWKSGYSETQTKAILRRLRDAGYLFIEYEGSKYGTNEYKLLLNRLPKRPPYMAPKNGRPEKVGADSDPGLNKPGADSEKPGADFVKVGADSDPNSSVNTSVNPPEVLNAKPVKKPDLVDGALKYAARGRVDVAAFPEDVQPVIKRFCELWGILPAKPNHSDFGLWIDDARLLKDAGGDLTISALESLKEKPYDWMLGGTPISRPGSLIKSVRARAGELLTQETSGYTGGWTPESLAAMKEKIRILKEGGAAPA